ncbi:MAG: hypothetical protein QM804_03420 [Propionicimonas sp.]
MRITVRHRWVTGWQWAFAIVLPVFIVMGRALLGAELGWIAVIGVFYGVPVMLALLLPPFLTRFDRQARRAFSVREPYARACFVEWSGLLLAGLAIPDADDQGALPSVLSRWFGLSPDVSTVVFYLAVMVAVVAWAIALAAAGWGISAAQQVRR